jgi:hypothetical protein
VEIERLYAGVAAHVHRMRPDVLVVCTADHYNVFFEACVPIFRIGRRRGGRRGGDHADLERRTVSIAADLARHIHRSSCAPASTSARVTRRGG